MGFYLRCPTPGTRAVSPSIQQAMMPVKALGSRPWHMQAKDTITEIKKSKARSMGTLSRPF